MAQTPAIKIDKGIPAPKGYKHIKYPFESMAVGDSFLHASGHHSAVYNLAKAASYRLTPKQFRGGKDATGALRVWRIA